MTEERDPYQVLGVSPEASDDDIRRAYHDRARRLHPDVVGESGLDEMRQLNQAWAVLKDPGRRAAHDTAHGRAPRAPAGSAGGGGGGGGGATPSGGQSASGATAGGPAGREFSGQPAWTGAAGRPPGRPYGSVLDFGIYAGWSLGEIARKDRGYLTWLRDRLDGKKYRIEIEKILESTANQPTDARETKKRR